MPQLNIDKDGNVTSFWNALNDGFVSKDFKVTKDSNDHRYTIEIVNNKGYVFGKGNTLVCPTKDVDMEHEYVSPTKLSVRFVQPFLIPEYVFAHFSLLTVLVKAGTINTPTFTKDLQKGGYTSEKYIDTNTSNTNTNETSSLDLMNSLFSFRI